MKETGARAPSGYVVLVFLCHFYEKNYHTLIIVLCPVHSGMQTAQRRTQIGSALFSFRHTLSRSLDVPLRAGTDTAATL